MACFDKIIALKELCAAITPGSGFYLNDIGISKTEIEQIITKDYASVQDFIDSKSAFAISQVQGDIYSFLSPQYKANSILAGSRIGQTEPGKVLITQSGMTGVEVKMFAPDSFVDFTISDLSLFIDQTGNVPVEVYDLKQGQLLGTITVPAVGGSIITSYDKLTIAAPRRELHLWLGYDSTLLGGISSYKTLSHNGCSTCTGFTFNNRYIRATGAEIAAPFTSVTPLTHTSGISFNYSVTCNHKDWLCSHRAILGSPFLYRTGMEIMLHGILAAINQRSSTNTLVGKEVLDQKLKHYTEQYEVTMRNLMQNMRVPNDVRCFYCNTGIKSLYVPPG